MTISKARNTILTLTALSGCMLFLLFSETAYNAALSALMLVLKKIIPVLLPFTVLSCIICEAISTDNRVRSILLAFMIGNICGAPIGSVLIGGLTEKGIISPKAAAYLIPAVSCSSPAFCISLVGKGLLNDKKFGIIIWCTQIIINLLITIAVISTQGLEDTSQPANGRTPTKKSNFILNASSALGAVAVSIVFFSTFTATVSDLLDLKLMGECIIGSILEMSGGCFASQKLCYPFSHLLSAFALGFGGISVLCQISSCTQGISKLPYVTLKLITSAICICAACINSLFF